ncbi:MAG: c-type cytochrome [Verrucomicrobiia bacterium]
MNTRAVVITFFVVLAILIGIAGWRGSKSSRPPFEIFSDMVRQDKIRPQTYLKLPGGNELKPVAGTISQNQTASSFATGMISGTTNYIEVIPVKVDTALLRRGKERYEIFCSHCHGFAGDANSVSRKIGAMPVVASLYEKRIVRMTDGEIFYVISNGRNLMSGHSPQIPSQDRWAIVAYVRALQLTRMGTIDDAPEQQRPSLLNQLTNNQK